MIKYALVLTIALALAACGSDSTEQKAGAAPSGHTTVNLPMGLPLMAGLTIKSNNNRAAGARQANATAVLTGDAPVEEVFAFYTDAMDDAGFGSSRETEVGEIRTLTASRDGEMGMVTVKPDDGKAMVMLVSRREP